MFSMRPSYKGGTDSGIKSLGVTVQPAAEVF